MSGSLYDVSFTDTFYFDATPDELWTALAKTHLFEQWWPWMKDVRLTGEPLTEGSTIDFMVDPPVPYKLTISVLVTEVDPARYISGDVRGDLSGRAHLSFEAREQGTDAEVHWDVEMANRAIRQVIRFARPVLMWAQHWAVGASLKGFRRYLADGRR